MAAAALVLGALVSGCSAADSPEPTASHRTGHSRGQASSEPTASASSSSTPSTPPPTTALSFSPRSGGKHLDECQRLEPGDDPAEFVYYPVLVTPAATVDLDSVTTDHTDGVVEAGSWVAPAGTTPETGTFKGWPPRFLAQDPNLQWSKRVPAAGATLESGVTYNVFLRLQVDPTPGDSEVDGLVLGYHDDNGSQASATWKATTTFSMDC
jgi:hypothetical protein